MTKHEEKVQELINLFIFSATPRTLEITLDNLDGARLTYNEKKEVVVWNEHGTHFPVSQLSDREIDAFIYDLHNP